MNAGSSYLGMAERANHRRRSIRDKGSPFELHQLTKEERAARGSLGGAGITRGPWLTKDVFVASVQPLY